MVVEVKKCRRCGVVKSPTDFSREKRYRDGLHPYCKACKSANTSRWYKENQDRVRAYRAGIITKQREYQRRHRARHRARCNAAQRRSYHSGLKYTIRAWRGLHRDRWLASMRAANQRRRFRKIGNGGTYTAAEWQTLCNQYGNVCLACGAAAPLTVDHVVPLSKGGANGIENIQPLCGPCNSRKGVQTIDYRRDSDSSSRAVTEGPKE